MNILAHIYLSGNEDMVKVGNFIGDYVKGKGYLAYRPPIIKGILLHRRIDDFTDHHSKPKKIKTLLRPYYRKYSGIVVDIFYDHFLTLHWDCYSDFDLESFVEAFHQLLREQFHILPAPVQSFVPRMIAQKRLLSYGDAAGVCHALKIMAKHTSLPDKSEEAIGVLLDHYDEIAGNFDAFFPKLIEYLRN
jgi:acyl carrier protein phosphodiesterase